MKLGIILGTGYESEDKHTVQRLVEAALDQGHEVNIFLTADGCYNAPTLAALADKGALLICCAKNMEARGLPDIPKVHGSTQYACASIVAEADRVIAFV
ncbi:MAG: DsrE family protein [Chloroflexota bacterium]|jgi:sulfur relay (sulfurtransferase) complex TusBCD TusD component (DsrE family)